MATSISITTEALLHCQKAIWSSVETGCFGARWSKELPAPSYLNLTRIYTRGWNLVIGNANLHCRLCVQLCVLVSLHCSRLPFALNDSLTSPNRDQHHSLAHPIPSQRGGQCERLQSPCYYSNSGGACVPQVVPVFLS
jgi:hypothetical protein